MTVVATTPSSGVVTLASIAGPAIAKMRAEVTWTEGFTRGPYYFPRGALTMRMISQIGMTMTAPSRK